MEETISLKDIFLTLKKRALMIIAITLVATITSGIISYFFLTPIYQASTQILVNQSKTEQSIYDSNQIRTNIELINTYRVIIKSPKILDKVENELNLDKSSLDGIAVNSEQDSQVFTISVENSDPALAVKIANTIASTFQKDITKIMNVDNVSILSKAELPEAPSPIKPRPLLNIAIALVVGLMVGVGVAFLLEFLDNTIKNEQDIERILGLPIIGVIGEMSEETKTISKKKATHVVRGEGIGS